MATLRFLGRQGLRQAVALGHDGYCLTSHTGELQDAGLQFSFPL